MGTSYKIIDLTKGGDRALLGRGTEDLMAGLPELPAPVQQAVYGSSVELDLPHNVDRARQYLRGLVAAGNVARQGKHGDDHTYTVACHVFDLGLSLEETLAVLNDEWNPHCIPPWSDDELETKVRNARNYRQNSGAPHASRSAHEEYAGFIANPSTIDASSDVAYPTALSAAELANGNFPPSEYLWRDFILYLLVNLIYGDGGIGKTLLALHIAVAVAAGLPSP